jgi:16S rRNA (adenine1518-N6/adenine1519-N6)-dimethyltransferase
MDFLESMGIKPKKELSQFFLIDGNIVKKILFTAHLQSGDKVLEIGPGPGVLTEALLEAQAKVFAFEKDDLLAKALLRFQNSNTSLEVFTGDFLEYPLDTLFSPKNKLKVIANIPYHISKEILLHLYRFHSLFSDLTLMMPQDVAKKILAKPASPAYGPLTLYTEFYTKDHITFDVSPGSFYPRPKVHSTVVHFVMQKPVLEDPNPFFEMIKKAFSQRRKQLAVALESMISKEQTLQALQEIKISITSRAEELSLSDFLMFWKKISGKELFTKHFHL